MHQLGAIDWIVDLDVNLQGPTGQKADRLDTSLKARRHKPTLESIESVGLCHRGRKLIYYLNLQSDLSFVSSYPTLHIILCLTQSPFSWRNTIFLTLYRFLDAVPFSWRSTVFLTQSPFSLRHAVALFFMPCSRPFLYAMQSPFSLCHAVALFFMPCSRPFLQAVAQSFQLPSSAVARPLPPYSISVHSDWCWRHWGSGAFAHALAVCSLRCSLVARLSSSPIFSTPQLIHGATLPVFMSRLRHNWK